MMFNLPQELIEHIGIHLDASSLCALRLVCRGLNDKIFRSWAKCLNTIRTDLGSQSLQSLLAIGQNESLREHIHGLFIQASRIGEFGGGLQWSRDEFGSLLTSQSNEQFKILQNCLWNNMKNCRSFYIHGPTEQDMKLETLTTSEVVMLFLNVVAEKGLEIQSFTVDLRGEHPSSHGRGSGWLHAPGLKDYFLLRYQPQFNQGWSHLQELHLYQDIRSDNVMWTRDLIQKAPNIRVLSLVFHSNESGVIKEILDLELPPLEGLYLHFVYLTAPMLLNFLHSSHQTLQRLKLRSIHLEHGGIDDDGRHRDWKYFLRALRTDFSKLHSISLFGLQGASTPGALTSKMLFQACLENDARLNNDLHDEKFELVTRNLRKEAPNKHVGRVLSVLGVTYEGRHMVTALERLEEAVDYI